MSGKITVRKADRKTLESLGVFSWPVWEKEPSTFDYSYDEQETFYVVAGKARVEPEGGGKPVEFGAGDLVTMPKGVKCVWKISDTIRKHYRFGG
ncbi:MAG: cupin domain-containing protein [Planctomycetota bacterium]|nr:cupin domain-containing protein [Planctomycetota bacterium]